MPRRPYQQLQHHRSEVNPFLRQPINNPPPVPFVRFRLDNSRLPQTTQPVRKNIRRNPFARLLKFLERSVSTHHHVANHQQRPPVSEPLQRNIHWTSRPNPVPARRLCLFRHARQSTKYYLRSASNQTLQPARPKPPASGYRSQEGYNQKAIDEKAKWHRREAAAASPLSNTLQAPDPARNLYEYCLSKPNEMASRALIYEHRLQERPIMNSL